jgi:serine/threonine-protein kinase
MLRISMLVLLVVAALLAGCALGFITGSGNVITQEEDYTDFDRLDISDGFHVDVSQGDDFSVVIRIDDNLLNHLRVAKQGETLSIGLDPGTNVRGDRVTLEADVTMPELAGADLSGGSHLNGDLQVADLTLKLSGGSHATLGGSAGDLTVDASGGSHAKLGGLSVADAGVDASGGSHVTVKPSGTLDADASGGSHVRYLGSPSLGKIDISGGASVEQE